MEIVHLNWLDVGFFEGLKHALAKKGLLPSYYVVYVGRAGVHRIRKRIQEHLTKGHLPPGGRAFVSFDDNPLSNEEVKQKEEGLIQEAQRQGFLIANRVPWSIGPFPQSEYSAVYVIIIERLFFPIFDPKDFSVHLYDYFMDQVLCGKPFSTKIHRMGDPLYITDLKRWGGFKLWVANRTASPFRFNPCVYCDAKFEEILRGHA